MIKNYLIFQATIGIKGLRMEEATKSSQEVQTILQKELEQEGFTVKVIVVPDTSIEYGVDIKLIYPVYNLIDKDAYDKHIELHQEIDKIKKELETKVD